MSQPYTRLWIVLLNVPQVAAAAALTIYSIWFDRYEWRNVGAGVIYTADAVLVVLLSQLANGVAWLFLRRNEANAAFLIRVALVSFSCVAILFWLAGRFIYAGA